MRRSMNGCGVIRNLATGTGRLSKNQIPLAPLTRCTLRGLTGGCTLRGLTGECVERTMTERSASRDFAVEGHQPHCDAD